MWTVVRRELVAWLRRPRSIVWAGALQLGLILFVVSLWPSGDEPLEPALLARLVIYDFFEKVLFLILLVTPLATASAFASERERATLHLLRLTRLSSLSIVMGKLVSALGYMLILLLASMPFLGLLLSMGGVSLRSILILHAFFAATIIYAGLIGMLMSLWCRRTASAVLASYAAIFAINIVFPSFQLGMQYFDMARQVQQMGLPLSVLEWPRGENLYSTPSKSWYYFIDLISPLSVYLNFRFVQLRELRPEQLGALELGPAGDYRMIYHYLGVAFATCCALVFLCARGLKRMSPRPVSADRRVAAMMRGQAPGVEMARLFLAGGLVALAFGFVANTFDDYAPLMQTVAAMWLAGAFLGDAGAGAIARERERGTLPLAALTLMTARDYIRKAIHPAIQSASALLLGYAAGSLLVSRSPLAASLTGHGLTTREAALSVFCAAGFGMAALALGLAFSARCKTLLAARVWTFLTLFALWLHWTLTGQFDLSAFDVIQHSDYPAFAKWLFVAVASAQVFVSTLAIYANPFVWADACFWREIDPASVQMQQLLLRQGVVVPVEAAPPPSMLQRHETLFELVWTSASSNPVPENLSMIVFACVLVVVPAALILLLARSARRRLVRDEFFAE